MSTHPTLSERDLELLSAYLDGELSETDRAALEQRLATESDLRRTLDELRATVGLLHALPPLKAPRDFTLDPAVYGKRAPWWQRLGFAAALQWSGALGTAVSVILIALGLLLGSGERQPAQKLAEPEASPPAGGAPAAAFLPTATLAMSEPISLPTSEEDTAAAEIAIAPPEVPAEPPPAPLAAPQISAPMTSARGAEAETFAGGLADEFAITLSPDVVPPETLFSESIPAPEAFGEAASGAAAEEGAQDSGEPGHERFAFSPTGTPAIGMAPPPTPTAEIVEPGLDIVEAERVATLREGPRWWLIGAGAAGLVLSLTLLVIGRRQAGL